MKSDSKTSINVWDPLVRVFHWSLALFFIVSYLSGDEESLLHVWSGYAIVTLLAIRIVWGIIGSKYARFSNFVYGPAEIRGYAKGMLKGDAPRYIGHNPLGGLMIVVLLLSLMATTTTGMLYYGAEEGKGPLAGVVAEQSIIMPSLVSSAHADDDGHEAKEHGDERYEYLEDLHEFFANFTLFLVMIHLAGVLVESAFHKESLVRAMWTGRKRVGPQV
ncbi:hypothetical protein Tel_08245 [Candidatus Tenderia electrophaga]|jgi:cytochrome b|uniref:Cytochrome b561 bacterial/Ni-hydrogenase domain-containing protein n=1 Tax=Candidatus Tenderia electrophaga TaxID=1748243 RepID=A0A0S2TDC5_9GAMM|nr:hypothetical protein Tel_08245 [Candidatus Tenderia electrophaga]